MKTIALCILMMVFINNCTVSPVKTEMEFANTCARQGLWKEAHMRWSKLLNLGQKTAALHNNIAVALEHLGRYKEARQAYEAALKLAPNNSRIKSNFEKFKKIVGTE